MTLEEALQALIDGKVLKEVNNPYYYRITDNKIWYSTKDCMWRSLEIKNGLRWLIEAFNVTTLSIHSPHTITIDGKTIELSEESFNELKRKFNE